MKKKNKRTSKLFYTRDEIIQYDQENGSNYLMKLDNSLILKNEHKFQEYKNDDLIEISFMGETRKYSKTLIHDLLTNEVMHNYLVQNITNELSTAVNICFIYDADTYDSIIITRAEFNLILSKIKTSLDIKEQMRAALLTSSSNMYSCKQKYDNKKHVCSIDETIVEVEISTLLNILTMNENDFNSFLNDELDMPFSKEQMCYCLVDFIQKERILSKYTFTSKVYDRYSKIRQFEFVDYESINKNLQTSDENIYGESVVEKINISEELENEIYKYCPDNYSPIEKAIYIYIVLCQIFTYDQEYYTTKNEEILERHQDFNNINVKNATNNEVIIYDFILLYAYFLRNIGIKYTINPELIVGNENISNILTYRFGEFLVSVDSLSNPIESDLTNVKTLGPIMNLKSTNKNSITNKKFEELIEKVYNDIIKKKEANITYETNLAEYETLYAGANLTNKEKLQVMLKQLKHSSLYGIDAVNYQRKLFNCLFKDENIKYNVIGSTIDNYKNYTTTPIIIISIFDGSNYTYYKINPNDPSSLDELSNVELEDMLELEEYIIINDVIPGIGGSQNVRKTKN